MFLRKFIDFQLKLTEEGKPLHKMRPLISALDTFCFEPNIKTHKAPHVRDAVDLKRWMMMVIFALIPCILMAVWNTGLQKFVYGSGDYKLMQEFIRSCRSLSDYFTFAFTDARYVQILWYGLLAYLPVMIISYAVGGLVEGIFACVRGHEIAEGFLVTGMLYALILPPTIPYWMVAIGVAAGVVFAKELFGGTGMNIMNPAMSCRAFLFFTFPAQMTGDVWVGTNPVEIRQSLLKMNSDANLGAIDGFSQATPLARFNVGMDIKRIHVDAIASSFPDAHQSIKTLPVVQKQFEKWASLQGGELSLGSLTPDQLKNFVTSAFDAGGLGLGADSYEGAARFAGLYYNQGIHTDWNMFLGNKLGCFGETSTLFCLLGALFLIITGIASWRTIVGVVVGALAFSSILFATSVYTGIDSGAWNPALFSLPPYRHLLMGGLAFGAVFMATDPVSSPTVNLGRWIYGILIGFITVLIRTINPAYPEGMMLAVLIGNACAPLIDRWAATLYRRPIRVRTS